MYGKSEKYVLNVKSSWFDQICKWRSALYCKQVPKWDNGFWSTDINCQIINNQQHRQSSYLYQNGKKAKRASCLRDRERVCERQRVAENGGWVGCKNGRWRNGPFWDNLGSWCKDYQIVRNYFNGEERLHSVIIIADAWRHLVLRHLVPFPQ